MPAFESNLKGEVVPSTRNDTTVEINVSAFIPERYISDEVTRVARNPKRKLSAADRLVSPANQLMQRGRKPSALAKTIAAALKFDYAEDKEAVEIQNYIRTEGMEKAITHFTDIPADSKLFEMIMEYI